MEKSNLATDPKKGAKLNARIVFSDESGISERPTVRRTWAPRGKTPIIASSGHWNTRSVIGAIACDPNGEHRRFYLLIVKHTVHKEDDLFFLKQLCRHEPGSLILVWDNLAAHRSKMIRDWAQTAKLTIEHFPSYAPELNPVEYAWATAKNRDLANLYPEGLPALDGHIRHMKRRLQRRADLLKGFLKKSGLFENV